MLCNSTCWDQINPYLVNCALPIRSGGIDRFIFKLCNTTITDYCDFGQWVNLIVDQKIRITAELIASKPASNNTKRQIYRCKPEQTIASVKTIDFKDYNNSCNGNYDFWNEIALFPNKYEIAWLTCDGHFYPFVKFNIDIDEIIEENSKDNTYKIGKITILNLTMLKPTNIHPSVVQELIDNINFAIVDGVLSPVADSECECGL